MWFVGEYKFTYTEERKSNSLWGEYEKVVSVYTIKDNELVLSSKGKEQEEFINYLWFLTNEEVAETAKELLEKGRTSEDDVRDFLELCEQSDYLWNG